MQTGRNEVEAQMQMIITFFFSMIWGGLFFVGVQAGQKARSSDANTILSIIFWMLHFLCEGVRGRTEDMHHLSQKCCWTNENNALDFAIAPHSW